MSERFALPERVLDGPDVDVKPPGQPEHPSASSSKPSTSLVAHHGEDDGVTARDGYPDLRGNASVNLDQAGAATSTARTEPNARTSNKTPLQLQVAELGKARRRNKGHPCGAHGVRAGPPRDPQQDGGTIGSSMPGLPVRNHRTSRLRCGGLWSTCRHDLRPGTQRNASVLRLGEEDLLKHARVQQSAETAGEVADQVSRVSGRDYADLGYEGSGAEDQDQDGYALEPPPVS